MINYHTTLLEKLPYLQVAICPRAKQINNQERKILKSFNPG